MKPSFIFRGHTLPYFQKTWFVTEAPKFSQIFAVISLTSRRCWTMSLSNHCISNRFPCVKLSCNFWKNFVYIEILHGTNMMVKNVLIICSIARLLLLFFLSIKQSHNTSPCTQTFAILNGCFLVSSRHLF